MLLDIKTNVFLTFRYYLKIKDNLDLFTLGLDIYRIETVTCMYFFCIVKRKNYGSKLRLR